MELHFERKEPTQTLWIWLVMYGSVIAGHQIVRCLPQTPFLCRIIMKTFDLFCFCLVCGTMTLKLLFHKNSGREGSNNGENVRETWWTLDSFLLLCSDSARQKQNGDWRWAKEKKKHRTGILLSMPCCEKAARDQLLEVVGNEEQWESEH